MNLLRKLIRESIKKIILETTEHDSLLAALPGLSLRYQETLDDGNEEVTILDLFNGRRFNCISHFNQVNRSVARTPVKSIR